MDENANNSETVNDPAATTPAQAADAPKANRAKGVKGVTAAAKEMKAAGKTRAEVAVAVTALYQTGGKSEKDAKSAASVIVYNIFGPVKARTTTGT